MAEKRGGENIWIAYADMLTVLLMVFLLLAMLFQVIVATSKIAGPEDQAGNQNAESEQTSKKAPTVIDDQSKFSVSNKNKPNKNGGIDDTTGSNEQVAANLPLVMVDTGALKPRDGDLRLNVELNRTYLTSIQQNEVRAWALRNKAALTTEKLRIYSVGRSVNVSTGDTLLMQVNRAVATMAVLQKEGAIIKNIRFDNLIVPDNIEDYIILRTEDSNANNSKTQ